MDPHGPSSAEAASIMALLQRWLSRQLAPEAMGWLTAELEHQRMTVDERRLAIGLTPRGEAQVAADRDYDPERLAAALRALPPLPRAQLLDALEQLAAAAERLPDPSR